jgi:hypothetical protein
VSRRALGRGRLLVGIGALSVLAGSVPPWWTIGGTVTAAQSGNAFDSPALGIVVFIAAIALIALLVLPFASRAGESALDRPAAYLLLAFVAVAAFLISIFQIQAEFGGVGLPDRASGLWLTGGGLLLVAWGVGELFAERPPAPF